MRHRMTRACGFLCLVAASGCGSDREATGKSPGDGGGSGGSAGATGAGGGAGAPPAGVPTLFYLDIVGGRVLRAGVDGADPTVLVSEGSAGADGIAVDVAQGFIYWTNMGAAAADDGFILRSRLDGSEVTTIVAPGGTFTPKQLKLDAEHGKLYWSDREGMRVMRANVDGTGIETLVTIAEGDAARADASNWGVGMAIDTSGGKVYWTQKGGDNAGTGSIRRAGIEIPAGEDAAHRTDVEILFDRLPEPIDLDLDLGERLIYWTDRGNPPSGNTVNRAPMDAPAGADPTGRTDQEILVHDLIEGIGLSLDLKADRMYFTDLGGSVYGANLDGSNPQTLLTGQGALTGIEVVTLAP